MNLKQFILLLCTISIVFLLCIEASINYQNKVKEIKVLKTKTIPQAALEAAKFEHKRMMKHSLKCYSTNSTAYLECLKDVHEPTSASINQKNEEK